MSPEHCSALELQTKVREDFTITEKHSAKIIFDFKNLCGPTRPLKPLHWCPIFMSICSGYIMYIKLFKCSTSEFVMQMGLKTNVKTCSNAFLQEEGASW